MGGGPGPWLKPPALKVGGRVLEPHSEHQVSEKQNVSSPFTHYDSILWRGSVLDLGRPVISFISPSSVGSISSV